jgi:hypothetical protein
MLSECNLNDYKYALSLLNGLNAVCTAARTSITLQTEAVPAAVDLKTYFELTSYRRAHTSRTFFDQAHC